MAKTPRKSEGTAAAPADHETGVTPAPSSVAASAPQVATEEPVADPAPKADNGPTPPETGTEGLATAGEGAVAMASAPASQATFTAGAAESGAVAKAPEGQTIMVVGPAKGRWRAGRHFTPEPVIIALSDITSEQLLALEDDPELVCYLTAAAL